MNPLDATLLETLRQIDAQRARLDEAAATIRRLLDHPIDAPTSAAAPLRRGKPAAPARGRKPKATPAAPASSRATRRNARTDARAPMPFTHALREVTARLAEPFDARDAQQALIDAHPHLERECRDGRVRGQFQYWGHKHDLIVVAPGAPGRPTKFKRAVDFSKDAKFQRYLDFRAQVPMPTDTEADQK